MISLIHTIDILSYFDKNIQKYSETSKSKINDTYEEENLNNITFNSESNILNENSKQEKVSNENIYTIDETNFDKTMKKNFKREKNYKKLAAISEKNKRKENLLLIFLQESVRAYVHLLCVVGVESTQSLGDLHLVDKAEQGRKKEFGKR